MIGAAFLLAATAASAQFAGSFSAYHALANRTTFLSVISAYQNTAFVCTGNAPQSLEISRAPSSAHGRARDQTLNGSAYLSRE